jgi:hypothetical protein
MKKVARGAVAIELGETASGFHLDVDQPGAPACITVPPHRRDSVDYAGLDPNEASVLQASQREGAVRLITSAVFRDERRGFRVFVAREDVDSDWDEEGAAALLRSDRHDRPSFSLPHTRIADQGSLRHELRHIRGADISRPAYRSNVDDATIAHVECVIPMRYGLYYVDFLGPVAEEADLNAMAERAIATVQVLPPKPHFSFVRWALTMLGLIVLLGGGVGMLVVRLSTSRRQTAKIGWISVRDETR